jgi:hypothetical protein
MGHPVTISCGNGLGRIPFCQGSVAAIDPPFLDRPKCFDTILIYLIGMHELPVIVDIKSCLERRLLKL